MPVYGVLGSRNIDYVNTNQVIYGNSTDGGVIVAINITNRSSEAISFSLACSSSATNPAITDWIEYGTLIIPNGTFERTNIILNSGQYIVVRGSSTSMNVVAWGIGSGVEASAASAATTNVPDGSSAAKAAASAQVIKSINPSATDGTYWIRTSVAAEAQQVYCVMDNAWDGGGWMIVAHNAAIDNVYQSTHIPRLTSNKSYVGSSGANSYSPSYNFSINVQDLPIKELAWCAYSSNWKNIITYTFGKFTTAKTIPDSTVWSRVFDLYHQDLPWLAASDIKVRPSYTTAPTNATEAFSAIALYNGRPDTRDYTANESYSPAMVLSRTQSVAGYPVTDSASCDGITGIFSWADRMTAGTEGINSIKGWDDFQDGNSLGDAWGIPSAVNFGRGSPSYIMVRV